jgi:MFS family permease
LPRPTIFKVTTATARSRWSRSDRELVGLVSFSHALQHVYVAVLPLTYPLAVVEFHTSYTALGLLLGVVAAVGGFLQGAAFLYERLAARLVLTAQNVLMAATAVMIALAPTFAIFGAGRFLGAVVSSPQHPVGNAVLARAFPERSGTVLSWHTTGGNVGTLMVPLLASLVIARWGWRSAVLLAAVPIALGGLLVWFRLREKPPERRPHESEARSFTVREVLKTRSAVVVLVASTIAAGGRGLGVVNGYVPAYLASGLHLNQLLVGVIFTVVLAGSVAGPVASGIVADRVGRWVVVVITYLLGGAALAAFGMTGPNLVLLLMFGLLVGVFAYAESPLLQALWADATRGAPQQAAFGAYFAISYGAGSAWIAILGWTIDHLGFTATFWIMGASFVAATAVLMLAPRRLSAATPAQA